MKLAFIGYGSLGRQLEQLLAEFEFPVTEKWYFDDLAAAAGVPGARPFYDYRNCDLRGCQVVLALGYRHLLVKQRIIAELQRLNVPLLSWIHPSCNISGSVGLAAGVVVMSGCNIGLNVRIAAGAILYENVTLAHDSTVGTAAFLAPGVTVAGHASIGDGTFLGCGVLVADRVRIGANCRVGIGSVVQHDLDDGVNGIGNPLKILTAELSL